MSKQKFLNISTESKVNSKLIIFWIILAFLILGGMFAYDHWSDVMMKKKGEIRVETGTMEKEEWGAMRKIREETKE